MIKNFPLSLYVFYTINPTNFMSKLYTVNIILMINNNKILLLHFHFFALMVCVIFTILIFIKDVFFGYINDGEFDLICLIWV